MLLTHTNGQCISYLLLSQADRSNVGARAWKTCDAGKDCKRPVVRGHGPADIAVAAACLQAAVVRGGWQSHFVLLWLQADRSNVGAGAGETCDAGRDLKWPVVRGHGPVDRAVATARLQAAVIGGGPQPNHAKNGQWKNRYQRGNTRVSFDLSIIFYLLWFHFETIHFC